MLSFLEEVADQSLQLQDHPERLVYVLPNKRAGSFLKSIIAKKLKKAVFAPKIYSIEAFVEEISGLEYTSNTQLLFELYQAYLNTSPDTADSFFDFCKWGQTLIQDFNEIDRYLIDPHKLFSYLSDVRKLEQWTATAEKTPLMEGYLRFWNTLEPIYHNFCQILLEKSLGYQGLVYRKACETLEAYMEATGLYEYVFLGFNALNKAESKIIRYILEKGRGQIYWDADTSFVEDKVHAAGYFIRQHMKTWPFLAGNRMKGLSGYYSSHKKIHIAAIPKNVAQAKYVGMLLKQLHTERNGSLENTALVLGDEALLNPILHSIPEEIGAINITMGYPLAHTPLEGLFAHLFELYLYMEPKGWFYRNVTSLLSHPYIEPLFVRNKINHAQVLLTAIKEKNWIYLTSGNLHAVPGIPPQLIKMLFFEKPATPEYFISKCAELILALKSHFQKDNQPIILEQLYHFYMLFNQLGEYVSLYPYVKDIRTLQSLYHTLLSVENVDFMGEPMEGLQVMGMLESRNLDFDTVILTSVNEGILPAGKSNNSMIPYDLKREFGLPTFKEKDAVYSYHFYRLLQRAKRVYLLYNTEPDVLEGGEKSRFISQLLTDPNSKATIEHRVATPEILPHAREPEVVSKDETVMEKLRERAARGFSPTSLANYIRNPIDFYKKTILGIDEAQEVDESITTSVFGTIIHAVLEELYQPFIGQYFDPGALRLLRPKIKEAVRTHFARAYPGTDIEKGRNLIAFNVLVRYLERLIEMEATHVQRHSIKLLALEKEMKVTLEVPGLDFPIYLRGIIDRVDFCEEGIRIIDYKTGNVVPKNVEIADWNELTDNYDLSKAFQLLCYASMYSEEEGISSLNAGIISLKNLNAGLLLFAIKEAGRRSGKETVINEEILSIFRERLGHLLQQIFDPDLPFTEKIT